MLTRLGEEDAVKKLEAFPAELAKAGLKDLVWQAKCALLQHRSQGVHRMTAAEFAKLVGEVKQCLAESDLNPMAARVAMEAAMNAERSRPELAVNAYQELGKLLAASKDENLSRFGATMLGAARRLGLVGNMIEIHGTTVDGKPFDWSKYKGKVVLIDFWATWCGPCLAEIPNIEKNYKDYHGRGFDVVSISIDQDRKDLDEFLEKHKQPWTMLHDVAEARGTDKSLSTYYGIFAIPQMMLVGRDGKVLSLSIRGDQLGDELAKLLGPGEKGGKAPSKGERSGRDKSPKRATE